MERSDVIVIGGGLAGFAAAWHLSEHHKVTVFEQNAAPGLQASAQNAGMIRLMDEDPVNRALALRTQRFFTHPPQDWDGLTPSRETGAVLSLAHDKFALHDAAAWLRAAGIPVEMLTQPEEVAPILRGARLQCHWYLKTARIASPTDILKGFVQGLTRNGGKIRCARKVQQLWVEDGRVQGVVTAQGHHAADNVVVAAGAWSEHFSPHGAPRFYPIRRTILHTEDHELAQPDHPWCWVHDVGCYVRPDKGRWQASPCDEQVVPPPVGEHSAGEPEECARELLRAKLTSWIPMLREARFTDGWTGLRTFATDRRPVLGPDPKMPGLWWAAALGGFGVSTAYAVGEALAYQFRGEPTPWLDQVGTHPGREYPTRWVIYPTGDHHNATVANAG